MKQIRWWVSINSQLIVHTWCYKMSKKGRAQQLLWESREAARNNLNRLRLYMKIILKTLQVSSPKIIIMIISRKEKMSISQGRSINRTRLIMSNLDLGWCLQLKRMPRIERCFWWPLHRHLITKNCQLTQRLWDLPFSTRPWIPAIETSAVMQAPNATTVALGTKATQWSLFSPIIQPQKRTSKRFSARALKLNWWEQFSTKNSKVSTHTSSIITIKFKDRLKKVIKICTLAMGVSLGPVWIHGRQQLLLMRLEATKRRSSRLCQPSDDPQPRERMRTKGVHQHRTLEDVLWRNLNRSLRVEKKVVRTAIQTTITSKPHLITPKTSCSI